MRDMPRFFLGFSHPELFSKIGGHSAAIRDIPPMIITPINETGFYPNEALRNLRDPFRLVDTQGA